MSLLFGKFALINDICEVDADPAYQFHRLATGLTDEIQIEVGRVRGEGGCHIFGGQEDREGEGLIKGYNMFG